MKESQLEAEKNYTYIISIVLIVLSFFSFFLFRNYKAKLQANKIITFQKDLVERKQQEILDSITYAKRIQSALLSHEELISENIHDHFIYFRPKDIVSGDFYWSFKKGEYFFFAVCDCTGHGVPGAFMSLLSIGFLNEAINVNNILDPGEVFTYVRNKLTNTISKESQKDGFDGVLLRIDKTRKEILYAAANMAPVKISNGEAIDMEKDRMPVGYSTKEESFHTFSCQLNQDEKLYVYSDGFPDQFGGPKGKKFMHKQLNKVLAQVSAMNFSDQKNHLNDSFENWKGNLEQIDDVCVIGIKI